MSIKKIPRDFRIVNDRQVRSALILTCTKDEHFYQINNISSLYFHLISHLNENKINILSSQVQITFVGSSLFQRSKKFHLKCFMKPEIFF